MKRITIVAVLACVASLTFAQNVAMSAGGKLEFAPVWSSGTVEFFGEDVDFSSATNTLAFGAFFDATYVQLGLDYVMTLGDTKVTMDDKDEELEGKQSMLGLSLLGKYPIAVNEKITVFPMVGFEYFKVLSMETEGEEVDDDEVLADASDFYLLLGGGADFALSGQLYVRPSVLYGINMTAKDGLYEKADSASGSTLKLGVSVGYKF